MFSIFILLLFWWSATDATQYLMDYKYHQAADRWFKLHRVPASWHEARLRCQHEGGFLASPVDKPMLVAMNTIMLENAPLPCGVYTGIHATFSKVDFYSIEGTPLSRVPARWAQEIPQNSKCSRSLNDCMVLLSDGTINDVDCSENFPYICYKQQTQSMNRPSACGTVDQEYKLDNRTGSCYKFHRVAELWSRAFMVCSAEGGHLAIVNSDTEAQVLKELYEKNPGETITSGFKNNALLGFLNWGRLGTWMTIHGQTLQEAGYATWAPGQPDNSTHQWSHEGQHCGGIFRSRLLDDMNCDIKYAFICEKSPVVDESFADRECSHRPQHL